MIAVITIAIRSEPRCRIVLVNFHFFIQNVLSTGYERSESRTKSRATGVSFKRPLQMQELGSRVQNSSENGRKSSEIIKNLFITMFI